MTDAQELLSQVIVDPNDHDPEKRMETYSEAIDFENLFVEPPELQSCDVVWLCSKLTFQKTKFDTYHSQRFWFCFLAAMWGIAFALTSYCETFYIRPIAKITTILGKIPGPRKCISIYSRCCKEVFFDCFREDEDGKMETKNV